MFGGTPSFEVLFAGDAERARGLAALLAGMERATRGDSRVLVGGAHKAHDLLDVGVPALRARVSKEIALGIEFCFARQAKVAVRVRVKGVIDFPLAAAQEQKSESRGKEQEIASLDQDCALHAIIERRKAETLTPKAERVPRVQGELLPSSFDNSRASKYLPPLTLTHSAWPSQKLALWPSGPWLSPVSG